MHQPQHQPASQQGCGKEQQQHGASQQVFVVLLHVSCFWKSSSSTCSSVQGQAPGTWSGAAGSGAAPGAGCGVGFVQQGQGLLLQPGPRSSSSAISLRALTIVLAQECPICR